MTKPPMRGALPKPTPPRLRQRTRATPPPPRFSVASDEECTPLMMRAIVASGPISEARQAMPPPMPREDHPSMAPAVFTLPPPDRKWVVPIVAAAAVFGTVAVLGLFAFVLQQGATTGAVAEAIAEQRTETVTDTSPIEQTPRLVQPSFDSRSAIAEVRREARELAAGCGARKAQRVRVAVSFQPSGRVASVDVRDRWGDSKEGRCVERALHYVTVSPFSGAKRTVEVDVDIQPASRSIRK